MGTMSTGKNVTKEAVKNIFGKVLNVLSNYPVVQQRLFREQVLETVYRTCKTRSERRYNLFFSRRC